MSLLSLLGLSAADNGVVAPLYIEDMFRVFNYKSAGGSETFSPGIDIRSNGGIQWIKARSTTGPNSVLLPIGSSGASRLVMNTTAAKDTFAAGEFDATATGFTVSNGDVNSNGVTYGAITFKDNRKFFTHTSVVKSSGSNATVDLSTLGTVGMVRVKRTDSTGSWYVWHRSGTSGKLLIGETTAAEATLGHITVSGTTLTLVDGVIANGTYHVEGYAHDASADGVIQCGSFTGSAVDVDLGWEPQYVVYKRLDGVSDWTMGDYARGMTADFGGWNELDYNSSSAEDAGSPGLKLNTRGFNANRSAAQTHIYMAIRRGPMRQPTTGTQVYKAIARTGNGVTTTVTGAGFPPDLLISKSRSNTWANAFFDRLRGLDNEIDSNSTAAESANASSATLTMDGVTVGSASQTNANGDTFIYEFFRRYPGVFDETCFTVPASNTNARITHNLAAVPELIIAKARSSSSSLGFITYNSLLGGVNKYQRVQTTEATQTAATWGTAVPTSTDFGIDSSSAFTTDDTYVAYLFATLAGISKVFNYTGNGSSQTINCNFSAGARFIMIKRTDAAGAWYFWDTVRGIVAGNDPHLSMNTTSAEVTTDDSIDPDSSGFIVNQLAATNINVTSATYIGFAIA